MLSIYYLCYFSVHILLQYMDFHHQLTVINDSISSEIQASHSVRFISAQKWKGLMLKVLHKLRKKQHYDRNLVDDLMMVVEKISEEKFIQTIMHIQPFKPNFMRRSRRSFSKERQEANIQRQSNEKHHLYEYKRLELSSIIKFKQEMHTKIRDSIFQIQQQNPKSSLLQQTLALITGEQTLSKEFQAQCHPYRLIIDQFLFLLQHKFENYISNNQKQVDIENVQQMLLYDLNLLQEFVIKASVPYLKIFKSKNKEEKMEFQIQLIAFIKKYLDKHAKINLLIKKIMKFSLKRSNIFEKLQKNIPNFIGIDSFNVQQKYRINGQYSFSLNSLVQFSQSPNSTVSLTKLQELRSNILKDIDEYYQRYNQSIKEQIAEISRPISSSKRQLKISVENQLQILKFLLCKGKVFLIDIMAQLKYLETVLGQDDLSYKYDDSSFMYAQLTVAIQILTQEFQ